MKIKWYGKLKQKIAWIWYRWTNRHLFDGSKTDIGATRIIGIKKVKGGKFGCDLSKKR